ncbi:hypothetical protein ACSNOI_37735 [Actinomadura kijaniata]|uniref:hypothetical protein n=1 Tax=Actinomadura kijaniata TaxID=46161 RepID=UPI003F1C19C8
MSEGQGIGWRDGAAIALLPLGLGWFIGTPYLWWNSVITAAAFFGEEPTPAEQEHAFHLMMGALACGFALPSVGLLLALAVRQRAAATGFVVALMLSLAGGAVTGVVSPDTARQVKNAIFPARPVEPLPPGYCGEHSGGDSDCPGG